MTAAELLRDLDRRGVELSVWGDRLRFRPTTAVDKSTRRALAEHKLELVSMLREGPAVSRGQSRYELPEGWTRSGWIDRLKYLADRCMHASRAEELRAWADELEQEGRFD